MAYLNREILNRAAKAVESAGCHYMCHAVEDAAEWAGQSPCDVMEEFEEILIQRNIPLDGSAFNTPLMLRDYNYAFPPETKAARVNFLRDLADELFPLEG